MKKFLVPVAAALSLMACSDVNDSFANNSQPSQTSVATPSALWKQLETDGVSEYFESNGVLHTGETSIQTNLNCKNSLHIDEYTLLLDEMEGIYREGTLVDGVCGKGVALASGEVAPLTINMVDEMSKGTIEFWFKPAEDFFNLDRTLLGNDEARIHFFVMNNLLVFQKNHADKHYYVMGPAKFKKGWNKIAGQWGDGYLSVWMNDELVAKIAHTEGYKPSNRGKPFGNLLVAGYKSSCCMEGPGMYSPLTTSGAYDQIRISIIPRYKNEGSIEDKDEEISSSSEEVIIEESSSSEDVIVEDSSSSEEVIIEESSSSEDVIVEESSSSENSDDDIIFFEDFDSGKNYGVTLIEGESGMAASLEYGQKIVLAALDEKIPRGTFEFSFKPGEQFESMYKAALVGTDESRMTILKVNDQLVFYKNLPDSYIKVSGKYTFKEGWNKIAAQWDGTSISLYVNGELIGETATTTVYTPSTRGTYYAAYGNSILVGYKSYCCTSDGEGSAYTSGSFDNILVTSKLLY